jgi:hypothetical protein
MKHLHQQAKWRSETALFAQASHNRAAAKRGQAALNFWFFWFKPKERYIIFKPQSH